MSDYAFRTLILFCIPLAIGVGFLSLLAPPCLGQVGVHAPPASSLSAADTYTATMTFDVASVRENKDVDSEAGFTVSGGFLPHTTHLRLENWTLENLVSYAYAVNRNQIIDVPNWPFPTLFVIEAKGDPDTDAKIATLNKEQERAEQQHMLQELLIERFQLKAHWETKKGDVYNLVLAKGKPKLVPEHVTPLSDNEIKRFGDRPVPSLYQKNDGQGYDFIAHRCSMTELVSAMSKQFGRPVIDSTNLTGKYDFVLKYKGRWDQDRPADDLDPMPPLDRALPEQLGLKLESAKGPVKTLVLDHVDKPRQN